MESNHEKQVYIARELFLGYDQQPLIEKFDLKWDEKFLYTEFLRVSYRIDRKTGEIQEEKEGEETGWEPCLDYNVVMTIYDMLCHSEERPRLSGEWTTLANLQVTGSSPSPDRFTAVTAKKLEGQPEKLRQVLERLGGIRQSVPASADACYEIPLFPFFPVLFQFWDGDEEFPPKITILWDKNSLQFMHFETLYYAMNHLLERIISLAEI